MALALRIKTRIKYAINTAAAGFAAWFWKSNVTNTATQILDTGGEQTRTIQPGRCYTFDGVDDYISFSNEIITADGDILTFFFKTSSSASMSILNQGLSTSYPISIFYGGGFLYIQKTDGAGNGRRCNTTSGLDDGNMHIISITTASSINDYVVTIDGVNQSFITTGNVGPFPGTAIEIGKRSTGLYLDGSLCGVKTTQSGNIIFFAKMDESDGANCYDSSGNGNDGIITNATLTSFHSTDTDVTISYQNNSGYTNNAGVLIPRDESNILFDVQGNNLEFSGRVKYNADLVESNCGTFDGINDYGDISAIESDVTGAFTVSCWYNATSWGTAYGGLFGGFGLNSGAGSAMTMSSFISVNLMYFEIQHTSSMTTSLTIPISNFETGEWHHLVWKWDGTTSANGVKVYVDGVLVGQRTADNTGIYYRSGTLTKIGANGRETFNGSIMNFRVFNYDIGNGNVTALYNDTYTGTAPKLQLPLSEGFGSVLYDVSGENNHVTLFNVTESSFWGENQNMYHYNIHNGFEHYDDDATGTDIIRVPYKLDGTQITPTITGYTKNQNNPAGKFHNDAETKIKFAAAAPALLNCDVSNFFFDGSGVPKAVGYSDFVANVGSANKIMMDVSVSNQKKNLLLYETALSGDDLTQTESFLNH